jgi:putative DNA primase/helicase
MDIVERVQCPAEFVAVSAITMLASVVGRQCGIHPRQRDDWVVVPNLWSLVVGPPGILKSPAFHESLHPLRRLEQSARATYEAEMEQYAFAATEAKARREVLENELKKTLKLGGDTSSLQTKYEHLAVDPPIEHRYIVNDSTVEKLGALLNENPHGLMLFRDELYGFLATMDRQGHENDRSFYCEAWAGTSAYTYDRISRGTLHIQAACVSILGGIQPGRLARYLREMFAGHGDDGLIQRFQLAVYPDVSPSWQNVDRAPNLEARQRVVKVVTALSNLDAAAFGALAAAPDAVPCLRFAEDAQARVDQWREEIECKIRGADGEHPVVVSHLAKYRSLLPSLALLFHLTDTADGSPPGPVSLASFELAAAWCDFLEEHARRIYQSLTAGVDLTVRLLASKLIAGKLGTLPTTFRARDVYRQQWAGLADREAVALALGVLVDLGWLRCDEEPPSPSRGGRRTFRYATNPNLGSMS